MLSELGFGMTRVLSTPELDSGGPLEWSLSSYVIVVVGRETKSSSSAVHRRHQLPHYAVSRGPRLRLCRLLLMLEDPHLQCPEDPACACAGC